MGRKVVTAEEYASRPRCSCHDEPMHKRGPLGWTCAVKGRASSLKRYHADPEAARERLRIWRANNPDKILTYDKRTKYGVTPEDYAAMLDEQGGLCAICGASGDDGVWGAQNLSIDHNHETGVVRGLLCRKCNSGIAYLGDSIEGVRTALAYLERTDQPST